MKVYHTQGGGARQITDGGKKSRNCIENMTSMVKNSNSDLTWSSNK